MEGTFRSCCCYFVWKMLCCSDDVIWSNIWAKEEEKKKACHCHHTHMKSMGLPGGLPSYHPVCWMAIKVTAITVSAVVTALNGFVLLSVISDSQSLCCLLHVCWGNTEKKNGVMCWVVWLSGCLVLSRAFFLPSFLPLFLFLSFFLLFHPLFILCLVC